jgi:hypothetical protein
MVKVWECLISKLNSSLSSSQEARKKEVRVNNTRVSFFIRER